MKDDEIKKTVRESYAAVAEKQSSCCAPSTSCCGSTKEAKTISDTIGYNKENLAGIPDEADMGLGCGNPTGHARLKPGEVVLDLGSGGGIDCFLAAKEVGESGYWEIFLDVPEGEHRFAYILDGQHQVADPTVPMRETDDFGGQNSILVLGDSV